MEKQLAPWPALILDSGGLTAAAENKERARAALDMSDQAAVPVWLPAVIVAESTQGSPMDARINQVISRVRILDIDETIAREAARLKHDAGMKGVEQTIDSIVVASAVVLGGAAILTSDPKDMAALADQRPELRIRVLRT